MDAAQTSATSSAGIRIYLGFVKLTSITHVEYLNKPTPIELNKICVALPVHSFV